MAPSGVSYRRKCDLGYIKADVAVSLQCPTPGPHFMVLYQGLSSGSHPRVSVQPFRYANLGY